MKNLAIYDREFRKIKKKAEKFATNYFRLSLLPEKRVDCDKH